MTNKITAISLHHINDINNINDLSKYYDLIVAHSKYLTDEEVYQDIVNNIFLKLDTYFKKYPDKLINGGFVSNTIRNEYRNHLNSAYTNRNMELDFQTETNYCESEDDVTSNFIQKVEDEERYNKIYKAMADLGDTEKFIINERKEKSLRKISIETGISYNVIWNFFHQFRRRVKNQK